MNLKNHTGIRPFLLSGDQGEKPTYAHARTFKFFTKDIPIATGRLANYVLGFFVTVSGQYTYTTTGTAIDWADVARALFESFELDNTLLGKPIAANFARGEFTGLMEYVSNGFQKLMPDTPLGNGNSSGAHGGGHTWFIPIAALLGIKGHHTAQLAVLMDTGTFKVKTAASGTVTGLSFANMTIHVHAATLAEPELRLGPGVQWVRYGSTMAATGTKHQIEALGNVSSLVNVEEGAGIAALLWMSSRRGYGGSFLPENLEYVNFPGRGLQQLTEIEPLFLDWLGAAGGMDQLPAAIQGHVVDGLAGTASPFPHAGGMYVPAYYGSDEASPLNKAGFVPLICPKRFMETSKMQVFQGTQDLYAKASASFGAEDVFLALQFHSWTPAQESAVLEKIIRSGLAQAVWNTNDLVPSTKVINKQGAGGINPAKTRFFARTWAPREVQANPPAVGK